MHARACTSTRAFHAVLSTLAVTPMALLLDGAGASMRQAIHLSLVLGAVLAPLGAASPAVCELCAQICELCAQISPHAFIDTMLNPTPNPLDARSIRVPLLARDPRPWRATAAAECPSAGH